MPDEPLAVLHGSALQAVPALLEQLARLRNGVRRKIALDTNATITDKKAYTIDPDNASGNENHFQGMAVLADGEHYIASGSNWKTGCGDVFSFRIPVGTNAGASVHAAAMEFPLWHTGGIDCWGDVIAVPAECPRFGADHPGRMAGRAAPPASEVNRSCVFFMHGPTLQLLPGPLRITRPDALATSAGFTRLSDGRFLTVVLTQPTEQRVHVDAYISVSDQLSAGFPPEPDWTADAALNQLGHYQSISLLTDESGEVFLVGLSGQKKGRIEVYALGNAMAAPADWVRNSTIDVDVSPADFSAGGCVGLVHGAVCLTAVSRFRAVKSRKLTITQLLPPLLA